MDKNAIIPLGGILVIICFFLPWIRACEVDITGYQLATQEEFGDSVYWVVPLIGLFILVGFFGLREKARIIAVLSSIGGFAFLLWKILIPIFKGEAKELGISLQIGGFGTILGFLLSLIGGARKPRSSR